MVGSGIGCPTMSQYRLEGGFCQRTPQMSTYELSASSCTR
ncbi:MAG: hypothetical protein H6Q86_3157 [candidate division NC10 bacterium]|nr:hypothetical protein [candidate division NC10 bacterium]